jgi:hypothetical protein
LLRSFFINNLQTIKANMKKLLKLSLAVVAIAALAACGDGGSSDAADKYIAAWKSNCNSYTGNDGNTYYQTFNLTFAKSTSSEMIGTYSNSIAYTDAACKNSAGAKNNNSSIKINIGGQVAYSGSQADAIVYTLISSGEARPGYMVADNTKMNIVIADSTGAKPTSGWGSNSPYTKQ